MMINKTEPILCDKCDELNSDFNLFVFDKEDGTSKLLIKCKNCGNEISTQLSKWVSLE